MSSKQKTVYICSSCEHLESRWVGQCPSCGEWNTFKQVITTTQKQTSRFVSKPSLQLLSGISSQNSSRVKTGIGELDRVLGGGFVPGSVTLLTGEPGVGKSTLLLQVASALASNQTTQNNSIFYVAGEESPGQIKLRAERLGVSDSAIQVLAETNVDSITNYLTSNPSEFIIIDSIQTMVTSDVTSSAGSVAQVRECAARLVKVAKKNSVPLVLVGHITKGGNIAGPKVLEHLVDVVCQLEGDPFHIFRLLRATKNRYGSTQEVGVFKMTERGYEEVLNPSAAFLEGRSLDGIGSVVTVTMEGNRPLLLEIQALTTRTVFGYPRRTVSGCDYNRLLLIIAALEKHCGIALQNHDVYVNVVGGFRIKNPEADLAIALAIVSSFKEKALGRNTVAFGEVGLSGEVRNVSQIERRVGEAKKMGFDNILEPFKIKTLRQALGDMLN